MRLASAIVASAALWAAQPATAATVVIQGEGRVTSSSGGHCPLLPGGCDPLPVPAVGTPYSFSFTLNDVDAPRAGMTDIIGGYIPFWMRNNVGFHSAFTFVNREIQSARGYGEPASDVCGGGGVFTITNNIFRINESYCGWIDSVYPQASINYEGRITRIFINGVATPEPATWALMLLGFGVTGAALRRRNQGPVPIPILQP